jgi:predicted amidohydrolase YtcJ
MVSSYFQADTVFKGANIVTVDPKAPRAEAVAMKDGKLIGVGSDSDIEGLIGPNTRVHDMRGKTIIPGFIDAHIHVLSSGVRHVMAADCDLRSVAAIQAALRERVETADRRDWIQGFKFDDTKTQENRDLVKEDLDVVSDKLPIMVTHRSGHVFYLNTVALELSGYHNESDDPAGGRLGRNPDTGELNGVIYERAAEPIREMVPQVTAEVRTQGLKTICGMLTAAGLTSVHDARVSNLELNTYQEGHDNGDLSLRVYMLMGQPHFPALRDAGVKTGLGDDRLRIGGIKMVSDGAIASRTAYLSQPYVNSDDHGILTMTPEETESEVMAMHKAGFQVAIHANGDLAIDMVLTAYEKAQREHPRLNTRHRIEHCTLVNPDLLSRMKNLGTIATPFCTYIYHHGDKMKFYGEERLEWMFAQRSFIDSGVVSTGATDYPPGPFEPLMGIQACVTRTDREGNLWGASQRISVEEALRLYTQNGAYASFEEDTKGSIEVGKLADLVVLSQDITTVDPFSIIDIPIEQTIINGKAVFEG